MMKKMTNWRSCIHSSTNRERKWSWMAMLLSLWCISVLPSCTSEGQMEDLGTLELSESGTLSMDATASTREVQVQSNDANWQCYSLNSWITVANKEGTLVIHVDANNTLQERKGSVVVKSGRLQKQLMVIQSKGEFTIDAGTETLNVDEFGGTFTVDVLTNDENWQAHSEESWISVTAQPTAQKVDLKVLRSTSRDERVGKVVITNPSSPNTSYEITIIQKGIAYFILPYMDFEHATRQAIQAFEEQRGGAFDEDPQERFLVFSTTSIAFPRIVYTIYEGGAYLYAQLDAVSTRILTGAAERVQLIDFLRQSGFSKMIDENTYQHETMSNLKVEIKAFYKNTPHLLFTYEPKQDKAYETFATLPLGFTRFDLGVAGVEEYEAKHGGEEIFRNDEELEYSCEPGLYDADGRLYFLHTEKDGSIEVERARQFFWATERACWEYKGYRNLLTDEFKALAAREGFKYVDFSILENMHIFYSEEKNLTMAVQVKKYYSDPKPVLTIQTNPGRFITGH